MLQNGMAMRRCRPACFFILLAAAWGCDGKQSPDLSGDSGVNDAMDCLGESMPIALDTGTGVLNGTLQLPNVCPPFPLALIHAGSGPTDRDGNSLALPGRNNSLAMLAEGLAAAGIASVRYDKRGIAASAAAGPMHERDLIFSTYVQDAQRCLVLLDGDARFGSITVIGHSEGSLIGLLAAQEIPGTRFISLSGPGRPAGVLLREQLAAQLTGAPLDDSYRIIADHRWYESRAQVSLRRRALAAAVVYRSQPAAAPGIASRGGALHQPGRMT